MLLFNLCYCTTYYILYYYIYICCFLSQDKPVRDYDRDTRVEKRKRLSLDHLQFTWISTGGGLLLAFIAWY